MKNIVLLSDGTGNGAAKRHKTNVWRLYQALDLSDPNKQVAFYDDGVGTQQFLPFKLLSGVFGLGLQRNVLELYMALCRTFEEGDKIYLFGFSRGAFTVRMLAGLIACRGLLAKDEDDPRSAARKQFIAYRSRYKRGYVHRLWRVVRRWSDQRNLKECAAPPDIEFIGAWDTVDAYGFPVHELVCLWDLFVWPLRFVDQKLSTKVQRACHALSIDEERASFRPVLWDENEPKTGGKKGESDCIGNHDGGSGDGHTQIEQVWFAGVHADVGGGYPRKKLALVTLDWMISKVEAKLGQAGGLRFISTVREDYKLRANCHETQHDSRSGLRAYYRYKPRHIARLCCEQGITGPVVHASVLERVRTGIAGYAPTALPAAYDVVDDGEAGPSESYDKRKMKMAHKYTRRRRWLYAAFVLATLTFAFLPLFLPGSSPHGGVGQIPLTGVPLRLATCVLPDCVRPWVEGWIEVLENPWELAWVVLTALLLWCLKAKWFLATRRHALAAWAGLRNGG